MHRALILILFLSTGSRLPGFEAQGSVGPVSYRVFAPDWIWQGESMSVLLVLEARRSPLDVEVTLRLPPGAFKEGDHGITEPTARHATVSVVPGETARHAFDKLVPRSDVPTGLHDLELHLRVSLPPGTAAEGDLERRTAFSIRTVRGSLVSPGSWSVLVPAMISLLTLPIFLLILKHYGKPGWWKTLPSPAPPAENKSWWTAQN